MARVDVIRSWDEYRSRSPLSAMTRWAGWRVNKKLARWSGRPLKRPVRLFWGQPMTVVYPEYVSSKIARYGYFETDLTAMFMDILRPGMTVYDVGSHFGYFSLLASALVENHGRVFAFEPTSKTYGVLCENAARRPNISCNNVAAYRETGEITFADQGLDDSSLNFIVGDQPESADSSAGSVIKVPAVKLDDFAEEHPDPDFVKIDAEGAEGPILEGMAAIITRSRPAISLEMGDQVCERTGNRPCRENAEFLLDHGYGVFDYRSGEAKKHSTVSTYSYDNLLFRHPDWGFAERKAA